MNPSLAAQLQSDQAALLEALMGGRRQSDACAISGLNVQQHGLAARGLNAYRANAHAGAGRALRASHPVVALMLGEESFGALARAFWHACPPERGDWAQWGEGLASFIEHDAQLADAPWLADVALTEWALHVLATAADVPCQPQTLGRLMTDDPRRLALRLAPHQPAWQSPWPVVSLVQAHRREGPGGNGVDAALLEEARSLLAQGVSQRVLVWREGWRPQVREALAGEAAFVQALSDGASLALAVERSPELDFAQWLHVAIQTRLLCAVVPVLTCGDPHE
jgi:hypothetical protein